jgi:uncharacterized protein YndB with AHSA1/START domain
MPVKKEEDGRRFVEAEVEVPGSPEDVWRAIATGKGISSWFVPSKVEEREGGTTVTSFGPGMDAVAKITHWNPPKSFTAEAADESLSVATEWTVEARAGGTCVVRVVHRWFADTDDWDGQFEGHAYGWATSFFRMLRLYLTHFPGQKCAAFQHTTVARSPASTTWRTIRSALDIDEQSDRFASISGAPGLSGEVERIQVDDPELLHAREHAPLVAAALNAAEGEEPELLLRVDRPAPGLAHVFIVPMGDQTVLSVRFHFFGDDADTVAAVAERAWGDWLAERFPREVTT